MSENINTFTFHNSTDHDIRTITLNDGSIWFVAKDIADVLGYSETAAMTRHLDYDESMSVKLTGMNMKSTLISEPGFYSATIRSRIEGAKKFKRWVTHEVLPQIRQTGAYVPSQPAPVEDIPQISPAAITSFLQATTDTFWNIEKALVEYRAMESSLRKAKKDASMIIRSIKEAFPESRETVDMLGGKIGLKKALEVEMR